MITRVSLKNFKLHASTEIEAAPITVFIGPNNSGKSSIFQALLSLRQAAADRWDSLYNPDRYSEIEQVKKRFRERLIIDIGEFSDVLRAGEHQLEFGVTGKVAVKEPYDAGEPLGVSFGIVIQDNRLAYHKGTLEIERLRAGDRLIPPQEMHWEWTRSTTGKEYRVLIEKGNLIFSATKSFALIQRGPITEPLRPEESVDIQALHEFLENAPVNLLNSLHPISPLRGFEEWAYPLPDSPATNLYSLTLADRAVALASLLAYDRELERRLSDWLEERFDIAIEARLVPPKRVIIRAKKPQDGKTSSLFLNEAPGSNKLSFNFIQIGLTPENETVLLCEPEAHLHPYGQSELMKLLLKVQKDRKLQYFIETHSEHVLHALLHGVAKGDLQKSELAIFYFENVNGEAKVRRLEIDERGGVKGGLPGFFDQSLTELTEYLDALKKS